MNSEKIDRIKGALYGFAIGDAMGATTEFMCYDEIKDEFGKVTDILGGGWLKLKPGHGTDDTAMSFCVMDALMKNDLENFEKNTMDNFIKWFESDPKDIGKQCSKALTYYRDHNEYIGEDENALGNGSVMRALPCALLEKDEFIELNVKQGRLTHNNKTCDDIIRKYSKAIITHINGGEFDMKNRVLLDPSGFIYHTMNNALYFAKKSSFEECMVGAVNSGGDADTIAAIAGSLSGSKHGFKNIPKRWVSQLSDEIKEWLENFLDFVVNYN